MDYRSQKTLFRKAMHYFINFLSEVEEMIDQAEDEGTPATLRNVFPTLEKFLVHILKINDRDMGTTIHYQSINDGNEATESGQIMMDKFSLKYDSDDLYSYSVLSKEIKKYYNEFKIIDFDFTLFGTEHNVSSIVEFSEERLEHNASRPKHPYRPPGEDFFIRNAALSLKKGSMKKPFGNYKVEMSPHQSFLITVGIFMRLTKNLIDLNPPPQKKRILANPLDHWSDFTVHPEIVFEIQGIDSLNFLYLNELIRSFIIHYTIYFNDYRLITKCKECGKILLPLRKCESSFCGPSCRGKDLIKRFGKDRTRCRDRQLTWFSNNLNKAVSLDRVKCEECNEFNTFEMSIGGRCKELKEKYIIKERILTEKDLCRAKKKYDSNLIKKELKNA